MRVYEFSKEYNISNKEVLQALQDVGFEVDSHMEPWLIIPKASADNAWRKIFDDMI